MFSYSPHLKPQWSEDLQEVELRGYQISKPENFRFFYNGSLVASVLLCVIYAVFYYMDVSDYWFNPEWTTDDALQQVFPFHEIHNPEIFKGDLIAETMAGYLAPLHYAVCAVVTWLVGDPVMMAHYVMLIQITLSLVFLWLTVRSLAGTAPAFLAVTWLLHTRPVMQRITSGLPRGWSAVVIPAFLFMLVKARHKGVLLVLFAACLLHPPAAFMCAVAYGFYLAMLYVLPSYRSIATRPLLILCLLSPIYIAVTLYVVQRPAEVGQMVDFKTASEMPEFQRPHGRFPFLPLDSIWWDVRMYSYQPFWHRLYNPGRVVKRAMPYIVATLLLLLLLSSVRRAHAPPVPFAVWSFFFAIVTVYSLSRLLAFKLYVPNRHLQFPMSFFLIVAVTAGIWRYFHVGKLMTKSRLLRLSLSYLLLVAVVILGTSDGLQGTANFNYSLYKKGKAFAWIKKNTPANALIAGHPTHIDALPLFGMRRAYVTTETSHPFYPTYYYEMKRRLEISLRAHYALSLRELVDLLEPESIDYFVFSKKRFYPEALEKERFFAPLNALVDELTSKPAETYAYKRIPRKLDMKNAAYLVFRDDHSVVINVAKLKQFLELNRS